MERIIDAFLKVLAGAVLFMVLYILMLWALQASDNRVCKEVSPVHAVDYGCPVKG